MGVRSCGAKKAAMMGVDPLQMDPGPTLGPEGTLVVGVRVLQEARGVDTTGESVNALHTRGDKLECTRGRTHQPFQGQLHQFSGEEQFCTGKAMATPTREVRGPSGTCCEDPRGVGSVQQILLGQWGLADCQEVA